MNKSFQLTPRISITAIDYQKDSSMVQVQMERNKELEIVADGMKNRRLKSFGVLDFLVHVVHAL